jgi:hypothetical protein
MSKRLVTAAVSLLVALGSCQESAPQKDAANTVDKATTPTSVDTSTVEPAAARAPSPNEYIDWETATINGRQPLLGKTEALFKALGHPDSLANPDMNDVCVSFYDRKFRYAYFKGSVVEVYGDTAVVGSLDFRYNPQLELHTPTMRLSHATTLEALAKQFPQAVKEQYSLNVYRIGKVTAVNLATGKDPSDDAWLLLFAGGKLIKIDYWMPC